MKKTSKALLLALCAVLLVAASVMGTMAYLTSTDKVENTFTVGKVAITLDEAKVDTAGEPIDGADRVDGNTYKLMPGHTYTKDPTVHVEAGSENSWIFVKVENGISAIETTETGKTIAEQIKANGWTELTGVPGVYYKQYTSSTTVTNLEVFNSFEINGNVSTWGSNADAKVIVTAYAIQADGFTTPDAAWSALNKA